MPFALFLLKGVGRTILSQIVIEAEAQAHGYSQTMLRVSVDTHLVAQNLTPAQAQFLVEEILDRIPAAGLGKDAGEH
jgi:hypothetical protein